MPPMNHTNPQPISELAESCFAFFSSALRFRTTIDASSLVSTCLEVLFQLDSKYNPCLRISLWHSRIPYSRTPVFLVQLGRVFCFSNVSFLGFYKASVAPPLNGATQAYCYFTSRFS